MLRAFIDERDHWGVRELASALGQPLSSTHWVLQILKTEGLVDWHPGRQKYVSGLELERWAAALSGLAKRHEISRRFAEALARKLKVRCVFGLYDQAKERLIWMASEPQDTGPDAPRLGEAIALAAGPAGWAVLAAFAPEERRSRLDQMPEGVRDAVARAAKAGYAYEAAPDLQGDAQYAVAVRDSRHKPVGALCLLVRPDRAAKMGTSIGPSLLTEASALETQMGGRILAGVRGTGPYLLADFGAAIHASMPDLHLEEGSGLSITDRLTAIQDGRAGYCACAVEWIDAAYRGSAPFTKPHDRIRLVAPLAILQLHILVRQDSPFRSLNDLSRARVAAGEPDYVSAQIWRDLLAVLARSKTVRARAFSRLANLAYADAIKAFENGEIDALVSLNRAPLGSYLELARRVPIRLIPLDPKTIQTFVGNHPAFRADQIPAGTYGGIATPKTPLPTITVATILGVATSADRGEHEVYGVTHLLVKNLKKVGASNATSFGLDLMDWVPGTALSMHPGAKRYFNEKLASRPASTKERRMRT